MLSNAKKEAENLDRKMPAEDLSQSLNL